MPTEFDLLAVNRGAVTAPAGCGKTQLIVETVCANKANKPALILTHTNAGVAALRSRLLKARVPNAHYRLATIDGFSIRLIGMFPMRSGHSPQLLEVKQPATDYPEIRNAAVGLLQAGHVNDALRATYSRLFVDEYQDCNHVQHALISHTAQLLPTCVLGDPMQAVFGFAGNRLIDWSSDVETTFTPVGELQTPWRWHLAGEEDLGHWLLAVRTQLLAGQPIDLRGAPAAVEWVKIHTDPATAAAQRMKAARTRMPGNRGTVLVIGDATKPQARHLLASQTPGAESVEAVELRDLMQFAQTFDTGRPSSISELANFAASVMTKVGAAELITRVKTLRAGRARTQPTPIESAAVAYADSPSLSTAARVLKAHSIQPTTHVFRPEVLQCCLSALSIAASGTCTFYEAAVRTRERHRHQGRTLPRRAVGSTLLLKGLEADVAVVLSPERMNAPNLYVALTRGARRLVVCSASPFIRPA